MTNKKEIIEQSQEQINKTAKVIIQTRQAVKQHTAEKEKQKEITARIKDNIMKLEQVKESLASVDGELAEALNKITPARNKTLKNITTFKNIQKKLLYINPLDKKELASKYNNHILILIKSIDKHTALLNQAQAIRTRKIKLLREHQALIDVISALHNKRNQKQIALDNLHFLFLEGEKLAHLGTIKAIIDRNKEREARQKEIGSKEQTKLLNNLNKELENEKEQEPINFIKQSKQDHKVEPTKKQD